MQPEQQQLTWVGGTTRGAPRIAPEVWEGHKDQLELLYQMGTLDQIIEFMADEYDFKPTRRQYIFQFKKWGFRKYGTGDETTLAADDDAVGTSDAHKRQHVSANSTGTDASRPEMKRLKTAPPVVVRDVYHGLGLPFDTINVDEQYLLRRDQLGKRGSVPHDFELWADMRRELDDPDATSISLNVSQDVEGFPSGAICELKRIADFLDAMQYRADAFALYVLILKRLKTSNCPDWMIQWTTIACAYNAHGENQLEIVQNLLQQRLANPSGSAFLAERFVMRMFLADTYSWAGDDGQAARIEQIAKLECSDTESLLDHLPPHHRALDLWVYHFLTRLHGVKRVHTIRRRNRLAEVSEKRRIDSPIRDPVATTKMTHQVPGPFELEPESGEMANPVLLSCLQWMVHELPHAKIDSYLSGHLGKLKYSKRPFNTVASVLLWALWDRWQSAAGSVSPDLLIWTSKAEKLMGISSAMVLSVCIRMTLLQFLLNDNAPYSVLFGQPDSGARLIELTTSAVERLVQQGHDDPATLAAEFLARFSNARTNEVRTDCQSAQFRNAARTHVKAYIKKSVKIELADFIFDTTAASRYRATRLTYNVMTSALLPTRASSMTQSDRASIRSFRERLARGVHTAAQMGRVTRPSSVYREQSSMMQGLLNMSEMSLALPHSIRTSTSVSTATRPAQSVLSMA